MSNPVRLVLVTLVLVLTGWHLCVRYRELAEDLDVLRSLSYADCINRLAPGLADTVAWLRQHPDKTVHILPHEENILLHQRLTEMLYPRRLFPLGEAALKPGDLLVVEASWPLHRHGKTVFSRGALRILVIP